MQTVDILGDERKLGGVLFHLSQRVMTGVWPDPFDRLSPPGIPIPDELRVAPKGFRGGQILGPVLRPQAGLRVAEGAESALLRDSGPGQGDQVGCAAEQREEFNRENYLITPQCAKVIFLS